MQGSPVFGDLRSTIAEKFNTYRFADYKEKVIDLLRRVTTVSVGVPAPEPEWRWFGGWRKLTDGVCDVLR